MFHIVLDTEVFRSEMLSFKSGRFERLADLVEEGQAAVYVTDIVEGEVRRAIGERIKEAVEHLRKKDVRRIVGYLQHAPSANVPGIASKLDEAAAQQDLNAAFDDLLNNLEADTISTDTVSPAELRKRYFQPAPPFAESGEKKHEFPDAMTFLAVEQRAETNDLEMHIVSADAGFHAAADGHARLHTVNTLREMIDLVLKTTETIAQAADNIATLLADDFKKLIADAFESSGFILLDENGDVSGVDVVAIKNLRTYVGEIDGKKVTVDFSADIVFTADISYDDPEQSVRDSETGEMYVFGSIDDEVRRVESVDGEAVIAIDVSDPQKSKILELFLTESDFTVDVYLPESYR